MISFNIIEVDTDKAKLKNILRKIRSAIEANADEGTFSDFGLTVFGYDQIPKSEWYELELIFDVGSREVRLSDNGDFIYIEICDDDDPYMKDIYES
ncbi:MAG: hypothetical protein NT178_08405 [Proteobacteria bacterium]|nr:hypothetical protein [Pseudomonadota bacterium]